MDIERIISQTEQWIKTVVIGCNFCPFAARVVQLKRIHYAVSDATDLKTCLEVFFQEITFMDEVEEMETAFVIFPHAFANFSDYLQLVSLAEDLLSEYDYDGIYQVASFHPDYCFAGEATEDPANFTNRSPFPMLHILREDSLTQALENYPDPEGIPQRNIDFAREKGLTYLQLLRASCLRE